MLWAERISPVLRSVMRTWWSSASTRKRCGRSRRRVARWCNPAGAAEGHGSFVVEAVVAEAVLTVGSGAGWGGFGGRPVCVAWRAACERSVWALFVVGLAERVELALEIVDSRADGRARSQRCRFGGTVRSCFGSGVAGEPSSAGRRGPGGGTRTRCGRRRTGRCRPGRCR